MPRENTGGPLGQITHFGQLSPFYLTSLIRQYEKCAQVVHIFQYLLYKG